MPETVGSDELQRESVYERRWSKVLPCLIRYEIQGMPGGAGGMLQEGATEEKGENARLVSSPQSQELTHERQRSMRGCLRESTDVLASFCSRRCCRESVVLSEASNHKFARCQ